MKLGEDSNTACAVVLEAGFRRAVAHWWKDRNNVWNLQSIIFEDNALDAMGNRGWVRLKEIRGWNSSAPEIEQWLWFLCSSLAEDYMKKSNFLTKDALENDVKPEIPDVKRYPRRRGGNKGRRTS